MLLLLVLGIQEVMVVLVVLEELVVFVGGIFESLIPKLFFRENNRIQKEFFWRNLRSKNP